MVALDRRASLGAAIEHRPARASLFAALATARRFIADGREDEVREIREFISTIVPDPDTETPSQNTGRALPSASARDAKECLWSWIRTSSSPARADAPQGLLQIGEVGARQLAGEEGPGLGSGRDDSSAGLRVRKLDAIIVDALRAAVSKPRRQRGKTRGLSPKGTAPVLTMDPDGRLSVGSGNKGWQRGTWGRIRAMSMPWRRQRG